MKCPCMMGKEKLDGLETRKLRIFYKAELGTLMSRIFYKQ